MAEVEFKLPNVKVDVKPILREGLWLDRGHSGHWQYDNCFFGITVPIDQHTGNLKEVLTIDERTFFEDSKKSGLDFKPGDLAGTKRENNFWKNYIIPIQKPESIVKEESVLFTLDLSNPIDYIRYKVLLTNSSPLGGSVSPSWGQRYDSGTYKIALVRNEETINEVVERANKKKEAYKYLSSIEKSSEELYDFLSVYWLSSKDYRQPSKDSSKEFYIAECEKIIETDINGFIAVVNDKDNYPIKVMLHKAVKLQVVNYSISSGFVTLEGVPLGLTMGDAVNFLKNPKNQEHYFRLDNFVKMNEQ